MEKIYEINQSERLSEESNTSKFGKCPNCGIVELKVDENGYIHCSICNNPYHLTIYPTLEERC